MFDYRLDDLPKRELGPELAPLPEGAAGTCRAIWFAGWHYTSCWRKATRLRDGAPVCGPCSRRRSAKALAE